MSNYQRNQYKDHPGVFVEVNSASVVCANALLCSESSLFVFPHKLILKTCGTTTLLLSLDKLFDIARSAGFSGDVEYFFYSRKSFMFPERQQFPHTHWNDEVDYLEKYFTGGAAYAVGKTNGPHWYCYLWENVIEVSDCTSSSGSENSLGLLKQNGGNDYTLEILMCDMDEEAAMMFTKEQGAGKNGQWIATSKLHSLYGRAHKNATGLKIDDFMFDPIGYSANGVTTAGHYFTVHVTPETICSYASFETNIPPSGVSYNDLVRNVVQIFKPKTFTVTLFAEKNKNENDDTFQDRLKACFCGDSVDGYKRTDRIHYEFEQYDLGYYDYTSI